MKLYIAYRKVIFNDGTVVYLQPEAVFEEREHLDKFITDAKNLLGSLSSSSNLKSLLDFFKIATIEYMYTTVIVGEKNESKNE